MKKVLILFSFMMILNIANTQISEIYKGLNNGSEFTYKSLEKGCLTINKSSLKQSYSLNCEKPIEFTVHTMEFKNNRIELNLTMHYFGDRKLVGFIEIKDNIITLSYGDSSASRQQVDKYKLK